MRLAIAAISLTIVYGLTASYTETASAAEGDLWSVNSTNVNVRSGPSTNTDVLITVNPGDKIVEIAAKGDWFYAEFPDRNKRGWIYGPLLVKPGSGEAKPKAPDTAQAPKEVPTPTATALTPAEPEPAKQALAAPVPAAQSEAPAAPSEAAAEQQSSPEPEAPAPVTPLAAATGEEPAAVKTFRETVAELNERAVSVAGINLFSDVRSAGGGAIQVLATETWASVPEAGQSSYMNALFDRWQSMAGGLGPLSLQIVDPSGAVMMERSGS
jgi:uncharacterized protein YgiM (DUF1202 family)